MGNCNAALLLLLLSGGVAAPSGGDVTTHHGIIFDAGSSGSRIHVYTWRSGGAAGEFELVEDDLLKAKPGLSSFAQDPSKAGASLDSLLAHARRKVPEEKWTSTPVFLMATAGLRLAGEEASAAILASVAATLEASPFLFRREWATIMSGDDEGIFGWVTVNYLLGTLQSNSGSASLPTTGVIDLGGGSVQLVYSPPLDSTLPEEYKGEVSFAGKTHKLYLKSHLGFGLDHARQSVARILARNSTSPIEHPCLAKGHKSTVRLADGKNMQLEFAGTGSFDDCTALYRALFDKAHCPMPPCSFNGAFQPAITDATSIFGFSYLYDRTSAIGLLDTSPLTYGTQRMTIKDVRDAAVSLCAATPGEQKVRFASCDDAEKWENFCGDVAYIDVLLDHGFGINQAMVLTMGNKVNGVELVWTLGAMIAKSASLSDLLARKTDEL